MFFTDFPITNPIMHQASTDRESLIEIYVHMAAANRSINGCIIQKIKSHNHHF